MSVKTDYSVEIKKLLSSFYTPVASKDEATDSTVYKTLTELHEEVTRILPKRWIYEDDVYQALLGLDFKVFKQINEEGKTELFYYLDAK